MENFELKTMKDNDIVTRGNALLGDIDISNLTIDDRIDSLAVLLTYKKMLDDRFSKQLQLLEDSISPDDFDASVQVGSHKVTLKVKEVIEAKAIGLTNEQLKTKYSISDDIISIDTKTIATLKKDKLELARAAQVTEILDAIKNGDLTCGKVKTKTVTVK